MSNGHISFPHVLNVRIPNAHSRRELQTQTSVWSEKIDLTISFILSLCLRKLSPDIITNINLTPILQLANMTHHHDRFAPVIVASLMHNGSQYASSTSTSSTVRPHVSNRYICTHCDMPHDNSAHLRATTHNVMAHDSNTHDGAVISPSTVLQKASSAAPTGLQVLALLVQSYHLSVVSIGIGA
jgi:hypothetical protein